MTHHDDTQAERLPFRFHLFEFLLVPGMLLQRIASLIFMLNVALASLVLRRGDIDRMEG